MTSSEIKSEFIKFLTQEKCKDQFFHNLEHYSHDERPVTLEFLLNNIDPEDFFRIGFDRVTAPEGRDFWLDMTNKWIEHMYDFEVNKIKRLDFTCLEMLLLNFAYHFLKEKIDPKDGKRFRKCVNPLRDKNAVLIDTTKVKKNIRLFHLTYYYQLDQVLSKDAYHKLDGIFKSIRNL